MVKFLFFISSFGDLNENCCPAGGRSWSLALKVWITCWKKTYNLSFLVLLWHFYIYKILFNIFYACMVGELELALLFIHWHKTFFGLAKMEYFVWVVVSMSSISLYNGKEFLSVNLFWQQMWKSSTLKRGVDLSWADSMPDLSVLKQSSLCWQLFSR